LCYFKNISRLLRLFTPMEMIGDLGQWCYSGASVVMFTSRKR
jgi:hypothetical protein